MPRKTADTQEPAETQEEPTRPRPVDDHGLVLDEHDLPLSGPARVVALGGRADPALAPSDPVTTPAEPTFPSTPEQEA